MTTANDLEYSIHHLCIYDKDPRNHMWPYLKWHHGMVYTDDVFRVQEFTHQPAADELTGISTAFLREPSGNLIQLQEAEKT